MDQIKYQFSRPTKGRTHYMTTLKVAIIVVFAIIALVNIPGHLVGAMTPGVQPPPAQEDPLRRYASQCLPARLAWNRTGRK